MRKLTHITQPAINVCPSQPVTASQRGQIASSMSLVDSYKYFKCVDLTPFCCVQK